MEDSCHFRHCGTILLTDSEESSVKGYIYIASAFETVTYPPLGRADLRFSRLGNLYLCLRSFADAWVCRSQMSPRCAQRYGSGAARPMVLCSRRAIGLKTSTVLLYYNGH